MYGVEEGTTVVSQCCRVAGLEKANVVIHIDFKQVVEVQAGLRGVQVW